jgi:N-acetylneuraminate synthase
MSDEIAFELVRPSEHYARLIMGWRNDPQTLQMSFHTEPKVWPEFFTEFKNEYFTVPDLPALLAIYKGEPIAFIRFRPTENPLNPRRRCCELSINVSPSARGKGFGKKVLIEMQKFAALQGYDDIYAEIKKENEPSLRAFTAAGFTPLSDVAKYIEDTDETVLISRLIVHLTPKREYDETYVVAEAGSNWHIGDDPKANKEMAFRLIDIAKESGANAIKFQVYRPETIYVKNAGQSDYLATAGIHQDIQEIFTQSAMPYPLIKELAEYCKSVEIDFMATAFSPDDFDQINPYVKVHKIASYEIGHIRLLEKAAESGKPVFMSTGAANEGEIKWAVDFYKKHGGKDLTLLQCTAQYPAEVQSMNLLAIPWLKHRFKLPVGLSDHSRHPTCAPVAAVALGATVIEKHFTYDNQLPGPDHAFALTPPELKEMVHAIRRTEAMLGSGVKVIQDEERELRAFARRGIQAIKDIHKGDVFKEGFNMAILRPGKRMQGVHPKHIDEVEGKIAKRTIPMGDGVQFDDF